MSAVALLSGCGGVRKCTSFNLRGVGEEHSATVGSPIAQAGCFKAHYEPVGLMKMLGGKPYPDDYFKPQVDKELLYSGREGDTLHITYREYTWNGYARQAFFQQVYYDVKTSKSITFQDWVIDVLSTDNGQIRFKIVKEPPRNDAYDLSYIQYTP